MATKKQVEEEYVYQAPITVHRPELRGPHAKRKAEFKIDSSDRVHEATWAFQWSARQKSWYYDEMDAASKLPEVEQLMRVGRVNVEAVKRSVSEETFEALLDVPGPAIEMVFELMTTWKVKGQEPEDADEDEPDLGESSAA